MSVAYVLLSAPLPTPAELAAAGAPRLARALAQGDQRPLGDDLLLEQRLLATFGWAAGEEQDLPVAALTAAEDGLDPSRQRLRMDPVCLRPDLADIILLPGHPPGLDARAAAALVAQVNDGLGEGGPRLVVGASPWRWYLEQDEPLDLQGPPPRRLAGHGIRLQRPAGADRRWLLGWLTELQLLLHGAAENARRVALGLPPVNSVWPWGGGVWPPAPAPSAASARSVLTTRPVTTGSSSLVYADCAFARGLARAAELPGSSIRPLAALAEAPAPAAALLVVHDPGPGVAIDPAEAEALWAAPLLAALAAGRLREIVIDSPTARQRIGRHHRLRFWRRW